MSRKMKIYAPTHKPKTGGITVYNDGDVACQLYVWDDNGITVGNIARQLGDLIQSPDPESFKRTLPVNEAYLATPHDPGFLCWMQGQVAEAVEHRRLERETGKYDEWEYVGVKAAIEKKRQGRN